MHPVIWGGLTMVTAAATNVRHLYVIRFFQGMAEASTFVGAVSQAFCDNVQLMNQFPQHYIMVRVFYRFIGYLNQR
jgi:hypothetical protein